MKILTSTSLRQKSNKTRNAKRTELLQPMDNEAHGTTIATTKLNLKKMELFSKILQSDLVTRFLRPFSFK